MFYFLLSAIGRISIIITRIAIHTNLKSCQINTSGQSINAGCRIAFFFQGQVNREMFLNILINQLPILIENIPLYIFDSAV